MIWLGSKKVGHDWMWFGRTSHKMVQSNFHLNEPSGDGVCLNDFEVARDFNWNDIPCERQLHFYCEKEL